jgi:D-alanyl-D-alanine carboxypeptidase/D-alanyl-D-alanine-endopeptidase (penicillin-binding protein 4)
MTREHRGPGLASPGRPTFVALRLAVLLLGAASLLAGDLLAQDAVTPPPAAASSPSGTATSSSEDPQRSRRRRRTTRRTRRRVPEPPIPRATMPRSASALSSDVGVMLGGGTRNGKWGVMIVSLTRGDTLYTHGADDLLQPASTMKLMTAALALEHFGPEHQFMTEVFRDGALDSTGTVQGNLYLRGAGDPGFSNRFLRGPADAPVDLLARLIAGGAGVTRVRGDIVADASAFESRKIPEGWQSRYLGLGYAAPVSALSLNENTVWVVVEPGLPGQPGLVRFEPSSSGITLGNKVRTVRGSRGASLSIRRVANGAVEARGWIGSRSSARRYELVVDEPALFTAGALRNALAEQGVIVEGSVRLGVTPPPAEHVAGLPSPPLSRLIAVMNRESVNHFGELLFRNAARAGAGEGSAQAGNALLRRFASEKLRVDSMDVYAADGSGLSVLDRTTARAMVHLLDYAHKAPWSASFHASLPVAGESELLRHRMRATPAQGNLHAKTGTTNTVISLAGYVTALDGEVIAFAFIYNGNDRSRARATIDQMGATLAGFVRE